MTDSSRRGFLKRTAAVVLVATSSVAAAQPVELPEVDYPSLPAEADSVQEFVPPGWRLELEADGDLNEDGLADRVLVLHSEDPSNVVTHGGLGADSLDTNPRILAVVFGRSDGGYSLALDNHTLIPRLDNPLQDDPIGGIVASGIEVVRGTMRVQLGFWMSAGSWYMGHKTCTFRWQDGRFALIGFDISETHRSTLDWESVSVNYLTGRIEHGRGNHETGDGTVEWSDFPTQPLLSIEDVGDGLAFTPEETR